MMSEWGIPFDYIENNWDDEQFALMGQMLCERLDGQRRAQKGKGGAVKSRDWMKQQGFLP